MSDSSLESVLKTFQSQPIIFFGAGVSLNSGIPIVHGGSNYEGLVDNILRHLGATESYIQTVVEREIPFEAFIDDLTIGSRIDQLMEVFDAEVPNHAHKFFAQCAANGLVSTFVTTNFDELLEKALDEAGITYQVFAQDCDFNQINWDSGKINVIKLHGTISQKKDLSVIIKRVAQKRFSLEFREVISRIFSGKDDRHVLIFGYSCSDIFDISPTIESLKGSNTRSISIFEHSTGNLSYNGDISNGSIKNPFKGYEGSRYRGNTDLILKQLGDALGILQIVTVRNPDNKWKEVTSSWASTSIKNRFSILGKVSFDISDLANAHSFFQAAIEIEDDSETKFILYLDLVPILISKGQYKEAKIYLEKAATLSESQTDHSHMVHLHVNMAELQLHENQHNDALENLQKAEVIIRQKQEPMDQCLLARALANMGEAYFGIGDPYKAHQVYLDALATAQSAGDLYSQAIALSGLAKFADLQSLHEDAISKAQYACQLWRSLGMGFFEVVTMIDIGGYLRNYGNVEEALKIDQEAIKKAVNNSWLTLEGIARGNLAIGLTELGKYLEAETEYLFAVDKTSGLLQTKYQINYALLLIKMERQWDAIELLTAAIEILQYESAYSQRNELRRALLNLSMAYLKINEGNSGVEAARESCKVAQELDNVSGELHAKINIGIGLFSLKRYKESIFELKEAHYLAQTYFGADSMDAIKVDNLINQIKQQSSDYSY